MVEILDKIIDSLYIANYNEIRNMTPTERANSVKIAVLWSWEVEWEAGEDDCEPAYLRYQKNPWFVHNSDINIVFTDPEGKSSDYLDMDKLKRVASVINENVVAGRKTIVFCRAAMERSPLATIVYLHDYRGLSWHDAIEAVSRMHPDTRLHSIERWVDLIKKKA